MNVVDLFMFRDQWEFDKTVGFLSAIHGDYFNVIRRAAQMRYKQDLRLGRRDSFINYLWHYHNIEKQKYPAGRYRQFTYCATCRNSYGASFKQCPVCSGEIKIAILKKGYRTK